jgi:hypothetical protein
MFNETKRHVSIGHETTCEAGEERILERCETTGLLTVAKL